MAQVNVDDFQRNPLGCLARVRMGETVVVTEGDYPIAEIRSLIDDDAPRRPSGLCKGEFQVPDDFDAPLSEDTLRDFEDS